MTLQSSGIISLNDIFSEATTNGDYVAGNNIQDLRDPLKVAWSPAVPQPPAVISLNDFYGRSASYAFPDLNLTVEFKNNTGNVFTFANLALGQDYFLFDCFETDSGINIKFEVADNNTPLTIASGGTLTVTRSIRLDNNTGKFTFRLLAANSGEFSNCSILLSRSPFTPVIFTPVAPGLIGASAWGWESANFASSHSYDHPIFYFSGSGTINATIRFTFT
jgi:hypothetical protein